MSELTEEGQIIYKVANLHEEIESLKAERDRLTAENQALRKEFALTTGLGMDATPEEYGDFIVDMTNRAIGWRDENQVLLKYVKALHHLRKKVQGFKDHGETKLGTHGMLMFETLAACEWNGQNREAGTETTTEIANGKKATT